MPRSLRTREAAEYLGVSPGTLEVWRCKGRGPRYCKLGKVVVYDPTDLDAFREARKVFTADAMPPSSVR
ncbi:helix-turn-helix domain-containing protein [Solidesulfovibrio carbinolicus]|jgi:predicted DNA-binding transcriptional regulator AlpA|uniref:DNA-binding protein n=1 Tax=Solidesulfovibrio carbinolicus TaxID=296842 RepID=A0A4P6HNR1_9BACT|nr:helix-turn-helix domain-containing protein [Solidesulfovibrio carbinolicus]QAZ66798.1 DNA-binding protein [Solidesulfovibrio carbinolicus]